MLSAPVAERLGRVQAGGPCRAASAALAQVHNHFNQERHLVTREVYKQRRSVALAEWRALAV